MFTLNMLFQKTWCSCNVFTFITRKSHSFMFTLNMLFQITWRSCILFTFITRIAKSFMFTLNMLLKISWCSCSVFTFITWISDSLMFSHHMLFQITWCSFSVVTLITYSCLLSMCTIWGSTNSIFSGNTQLSSGAAVQESCYQSPHSQGVWRSMSYKDPDHNGRQR